MRTTVAIMLSFLLGLATSASGENSPANPDQPKAEAEAASESPDPGVGKTEPVPLEAAAAAEQEFVPPDGWRPKQRGQFTVYCRKDYQVRGTRIPAEVCYDEAGIRVMLKQQLEERARVDQMRRVCASHGACGTT